MNIKKTLLLIVIVIALGGAGVFTYLSFFSSDAPVATSTQIITTNSILPYGSELSFDQVKEFNSTGRIFSYPAVTPAEIGTQLNEIMEVRQ